MSCNHDYSRRERQRVLKTMSISVRLLNVITPVVLSWYLIDALDPRREVPYEALAVYSLVLATFVATKESARWTRVKETHANGGWWVMVWLALTLAIITAHIWEPQRFEIPRYLLVQLVIVFALFLGSDTAKKFFIRRFSSLL